MSGQEILDVLKETPKVKQLAIVESERVKNLTYEGKAKYAEEMAISVPLFTQAIKIQGEIILDQKIEIDQYKTKFQITPQDEKILEESREQIIKSLTVDESDKIILTQIKEKMNKYQSKGMFSQVIAIASSSPITPEKITKINNQLRKT